MVEYQSTFQISKTLFSTIQIQIRLSFKSILNGIKEFRLVEIIIESDFKFWFIGIDNYSNTGTISRNIKSFDQIPNPTLIRVPFYGSGLKETDHFWNVMDHSLSKLDPKGQIWKRLGHFQLGCFHWTVVEKRRGYNVLKINSTVNLTVNLGVNPVYFCNPIIFID